MLQGDLNSGHRQCSHAITPLQPRGRRLMRRTLINVGITADAGQLGLLKQLCCKGASKFSKAAFTHEFRTVGALPLTTKLCRLKLKIENTPNAKPSMFFFWQFGNLIFCKITKERLFPIYRSHDMQQRVHVTWCSLCGQRRIKK